MRISTRGEVIRLTRKNLNHGRHKNSQQQITFLDHRYVVVGYCTLVSLINNLQWFLRVEQALFVAPRH